MTCASATYKLQAHLEKVFFFFSVPPQANQAAGGFGVVYKGLMGDTTVAIKELKPLHDTQLDMFKEFMHEVQIMR